MKKTIVLKLLHHGGNLLSPGSRSERQSRQYVNGTVVGINGHDCWAYDQAASSGRVEAKNK
jgi:hypothetical protein